LSKSALFEYYKSRSTKGPIDDLSSFKGYDERHAMRLEKSLPIINEIGAYIYQHKSLVTPQSPIGKAFEYCSNRWTSLQNYLTNGMLEIDSNLVENSIRPLALGRKNYLFAGSHSLSCETGMLPKTLPCFTVFLPPAKVTTSIRRNGSPMSSKTSTTPKLPDSKICCPNLLTKT
jgi:hypothetical protein